MIAVQTDGRDIDTLYAELTGEASVQRTSGHGNRDEREKSETWTQIPQTQPHDPTYYDRPLLQSSVWTWAIPTYYWIGGLAGASAVFAAALQLQDRQRHRTLIRRCHFIAIAGAMVSGALLVYDLGRPARFLNMLRVFRPTSPMNMGAWILTGSGGSFTGALLLASTPLATPVGLIAGVFGAALATYTGVLVGNTAVPLWNSSRVSLPILFGASAITSVGSLFALIEPTPETRLFGNVGRVCELAASVMMEREASRVEYVARPLKRGFSGVMWKTAAVLTGTSLAAALLPKQNKGTQLVSGVLGVLGSLLIRFAVEHAGKVSARDPRATFRQQRS